MSRNIPFEINNREYARERGVRSMCTKGGGVHILAILVRTYLLDIPLLTIVVRNATLLCFEPIETISITKKDRQK